jgi:hypothetical protein
MADVISGESPKYGLFVTQTTMLLRPSPNARCRFPLYANYPTLKIRLDTGVDRMTDV